MARLRRASQVALIGNIAFGCCVLLRYVNYLHEEVLVSMLLVLGWFLGVWINLAVNTWIIILLCKKRLAEAAVPLWLLWINAGFVVFEIYYYLFI